MSRVPDSLLRSYERYAPASASAVERLFRLLVAGACIAFGAFGLYLTTIKIAPRAIPQAMQRVRTQFIIAEPKKPPAPIKKAEKKPIDLTKKAELAQKVEEEQKVREPPPVRKVFGLRRVYSQGIGAGGSMADAVIGKLGNTLNKEFDTLTATDREIKGQVVSATTVTTIPKIKKYIKPQYTQEMLDNRIEGIIKVRVLVDVDGKVVKATAMSDLGYGSMQEAMKACLSMEFEPALRGNEAVAVWIIVPVKFVLLG